MLLSKPTCSTSFEAAFKRIQEYVSRQAVASTVRVVFMTDGADTSSSNLGMATQLFQAFLNSCRRNVVIHTLGFSAGHKRQFLEKIRLMGSTEGVYRYAEEDGLDSSFQELFDFLEQTSVRKFQVGKISAAATPTRTPGSGLLRFDEIVKVTAEQQHPFDGHSDVQITMDDGETIMLKPAPADIMFKIRCIEESPITCEKELADAQRALHTVEEGLSVPKAQRMAVHQAKMAVQQQLDLFHQLFADVSRGVATGDCLTARLNSLRHENVFSKARRAREMNKRATKNADKALAIEARLRSLPTITYGVHSQLWSAKALGQELTCMLSGDTVEEVMCETHDDVMVMALRVVRPEHCIDAPTQLHVETICVGGYSHQAFMTTAGYTIARSGHERAHGGFATQLTSDTGLFLAADGQRMNAALPLFLNTQHWARVECMLEPMLAYFFTLDPLGFKPDQLIAIFGVLGQALSLQAAGQWAKSEWSAWVIADLTRLCQAILPKALAYLHSGHYTGMVRGDLLEEFIASPAGRTKERMPSLTVVVGWAHASGRVVDDAFRLAFAEELCRRTLGFCYKGQAELAAETLEKLVYGPDEAASVCTSAGDRAKQAMDGNDAAKEQQFIEFADYKLGSLGKSKATALRHRYRKNGPPSAEGLMDTTQGFVARPIAAYDEHSCAFMDGIVNAELAKVAQHSGPVGAMFGGVATCAAMSGETKRLVLIQAMQFLTNDAVNRAVAQGEYLNSIEHMHTEDAVATMSSALHARLERKREERWAARVVARNELTTAKLIASSTDPRAIAGRVMAACPTRGGGVFDRLVGLLCAGEVDGNAIPLLRKKVRLALTGRMRLDAADSTVYDVLANGESWVSCPEAIAERLAQAIGLEAFLKVEAEMRGTWGWVYRASDIPNRHGYHNSHPNPDLCRSFTGFELHAHR
eukprot:COSAG01_NODE_5596_length_4157_cov_253.600296_1_plen_926_part_00